MRNTDGKLGFLKHVHQANLMAFSKEQHDFVAVFDRNCMNKLGYSSKEQDWTLVYYPSNAKSTSDPKVKAMKVHYPQVTSYGETVHWLDMVYAEDTMRWNKHANICLQSHGINMAILILDTNSLRNLSKQQHEMVRVFRAGVSHVINVHQMKLVPVVYPVRKEGKFGDETLRLEKVIGVDLQNVPLPQLLLVNGKTKSNARFGYAMMDPDAFIPELVQHWIINRILNDDLAHKKDQISLLTKKMADKDIYEAMTQN